MCQVHAGAYVSLLAPGKTDYTACHSRKNTTKTLHVGPITHTHDRQKSSGKKKQRKYVKMKQRKETKAIKEKGKKREETTRNARKIKTRRGSKERKREKMSY